MMKTCREIGVFEEVTEEQLADQTTVIRTDYLAIWSGARGDPEKDKGKAEYRRAKNWTAKYMWLGKLIG